jgi:hypothetical protein
MAMQINLTGVVTVKYQLTAGIGNLKEIGQAEDQPTFDVRAFFHNVPGDANGGPQGPPIDVQFLGEIAIVRLAMSKWDPTNFDEIKKRNAVATAGIILGTEVGTLMLDAKPIRILLSSTTRPINFPNCLMREAYSINMGTKYSTAIMQFEAHRVPGSNGLANEGILYDADDAEYT